MPQKGLSRTAAHLVPRDKFDVEAVGRARTAGFPAVEPLLDELLEWTQDGNWPVAAPVISLLASISTPLVPRIRVVLNGSDDIWKYWCLAVVMDFPKDAKQMLSAELRRLVKSPTQSEREEGVAERAEYILDELEAATEEPLI